MRYQFSNSGRSAPFFQKNSGRSAPFFIIIVDCEMNPAYNSCKKEEILADFFEAPQSRRGLIPDQRSCVEGEPPGD